MRWGNMRGKYIEQSDEYKASGVSHDVLDEI